MNENIDLTKILKNCPKGWKFYSSVFGEVEFKTIEFEQLKHIHNPLIGINSLFEEDLYPIKFIAQGVKSSVSKAGEHIKGKGECTFFPSKDQRDWSKFSAPWYKKEKFDPKTLKSFDRVLVSYGESNWKCKLFSHIDNNESKYKYDCCDALYEYCIPYNEKTKHLVGTKEEAPEYYRYWED